MVNEKKELTVDDLIIEYIMYKSKNGYDPSFYAKEFFDFLKFFESKMEVKDSLYGNELFIRFFERKSQYDWADYENIKGKKEKKYNPHIDMTYDVNKLDYLFKINYNFSMYDGSVINTYFMNSDDVKKIRLVIEEYVSNLPKRKLEDKKDLKLNCLLVGKKFAAEIILKIWDSYVYNNINSGKWPKQCIDINKYLFDLDLAEVINVPSIKKELFELYDVLSKRIAIMYSCDKNLEICSCDNKYLTKSNYDLLITGYEDIMNKYFGDFCYNKKVLSLDVSNNIFKDTHKVDDTYEWNDEDMITVVNFVDKNNIKKMIKNIENR